MRSAYKSNYHLVQAHVLGGASSDVAKKYNVRIFPMLVFFDAKARSCAAQVGSVSAVPAPKLQQQIERITQLPKPKQRFVMEMLDTVLAQAGR